MNMFLATLFCCAAFVAAYDDGQWRGEGLLESQDHYGKGYYGGVYGAAYVPAYSQYSAYAHGAAPIGADGRVVDTADVAVAKAQHYAAYSNAAHENHAGAVYAAPLAYATPLAYAPAAYAAYAPAVYGAHAGYYGAAPIGHDGRVVDTPAVAHAKAQHFAAKAAASHGAYHY